MMIKGLDQEGIIDKLLQQAENGSIGLETDFSSFEWADFWEAVSVSGMSTKLSEKCLKILGNFCRNSGEKSTSWGNTLFTLLIFLYALVMQKTEEELKTIERKMLSSRSVRFQQAFGYFQEINVMKNSGVNHT